MDLITLLSAYRDNNPRRNNVGVALLMVGGVALVDLLAVQTSAGRHDRNRGKRQSYANRSGFPDGVQNARGAAREFAKNSAPGLRLPEISSAG